MLNCCISANYGSRGRKALGPNPGQGGEAAAAPRARVGAPPGDGITY
jgi:hypothetical protein